LRLLEALKLPTAVPSELRARPDEIVQCMLLDKKTEGRELRFVLPSRLGHVETVRGVSAELALSVL
jgi:3-dehydroquinate synthase